MVVNKNYIISPFVALLLADYDVIPFVFQPAD